MAHFKGPSSFWSRIIHGIIEIIDIRFHGSGLILGWAPDSFCEKTINVLLKWTLFLAGPHIQAIQISCPLCANVDIKDSWANQILQRAHN